MDTVTHPAPTAPTTAPTTLRVHAIDPGHLDHVRASGTDGHGNGIAPFSASGEGEPLRCCLRYARAGERIALISYAPLPGPSVWREVGPVYVHADACPGYDAVDALPADLATGPALLRTYDAERAMSYAHNTLVTEPVELTTAVLRLLAEPDVATVHVRTVRPQCFLYAVTAGER